MKRSLIFLIIAGALVSIGIVISFYSAKLSLEEITMEEVKLIPGKSVEIVKVLNPTKSERGVIAVQLDNFDDESINAKVLGPLGSQLVSDTLTDKTYQKDFEIYSEGKYNLVMENFGQQELSGIVAIGYLPSESAQFFAYSGIVIILIGLVGLIGSGIYAIKNRRKGKIS